MADNDDGKDDDDDDSDGRDVYCWRGASLPSQRSVRMFPIPPASITAVSGCGSIISNAFCSSSHHSSQLS